MRKVIILLAFSACLASALPHSRVERRENWSSREDDLDLMVDSTELDNKLFPDVGYKSGPITWKLNEPAYGFEVESVAARDNEGPAIQADAARPLSKRVLEVKPTESANSRAERINAIAANNREIRLVGPNQKEIVMKDDLPTKMLVALENLQQEASDVWGQVNEKLDKGWTELKTMVEKAVAPPEKSKKVEENIVGMQKNLRETLANNKIPAIVSISDLDNYSMADEDIGTAAKQQAESAGTKIKGFLSNIGLNEDNQKKASEALSKAGTSVSETMTKDLPDALKKASSAVSDTVTKDIPDAFKNIFG